MMNHDFYIKAPKTILDKSLPLTDFKKEDNSYMTILEYVANQGHTIERYSTDGYFLKGFALNINGLDELRAKVKEFNLIENQNFFILTIAEAYEELKKDIWITKEV